MIECPECETSIEIDEFDDLEDCGNYVSASTLVCCPCCDNTFTVRTTYNWTGEFEID